MPDSVDGTGLVESTPVLAAAVGEHPPEGPSSGPVDREQRRRAADNARRVRSVSNPAVWALCTSRTASRL
jgi:hypothetical protein